MIFRIIQSKYFKLKKRSKKGELIVNKLSRLSIIPKFNGKTLGDRQINDRTLSNSGNNHANFKMINNPTGKKKVLSLVEDLPQPWSVYKFLKSDL